MNPINRLDKTASTDLSMSTTIGDGLAALYDHVNHCRSSNCLHAKALYEEMHSPCESQPLLESETEALQTKSGFRPISDLLKMVKRKSTFNPN